MLECFVERKWNERTNRTLDDFAQIRAQLGVDRVTVYGRFLPYFIRRYGVRVYRGRTVIWITGGPQYSARSHIYGPVSRRYGDGAQP